MDMIPVQEVKRRGMAAVDEALADGPVHLVKSNRPAYVVMSERDYHELMFDLAEARLAASEMDLTAGRVRRGNTADLMRQLTSEK